ncbi:MAG: hypothetical protein JOY78_18070 [Pseudonocardia sp.]|nr:hypothetical protein [Pseudonocardia sp.]
MSSTLATPPAPRPPLRHRSRLAAIAGILAALGIAAGVAAACVSREPATAPSERAAASQVCALLSTAQAAAAADASIQAGQPSQGQDGPRCDWYTTTAPHRVALELERIDQNLYKAVKANFAATSIGELGDEAYLAKDNALYVQPAAIYLRAVVTTADGRNEPAAEQQAATEALTHLPG